MVKHEMQEEINDLLEEFDDAEGSDEASDSLEEGEEVSEEGGSASEDEEFAEDEIDSGSDEDDADAADDAVADDSDDELVADDAVDDSENDDEASTPDPNLSVIEELRAQNQKLMEMIQAGNKVEEKPADKSEEKKPAKTLDSLMNEVSFEEIMSDKDLFMSFMQNAMQIAQEQSVERVATTMPQFVMNQVEQQRVLTEATTNFYQGNEKLVPHKKIVGMLTNEVIAEHQDWSLDQVLTETADRSYKLLNLKKEALSQDTPDAPQGRRNKKPALNKRNSSGKRATPKLSKLQKEINDLL